MRSLRVFGDQRVLYRTRGGRAVMLDAYCPHLGADLGQGGELEGDVLRCPFHGWGFSPSGRCSSIPYAKRIPEHTPLRAWQLEERQGRIWSWHAEDGRSPSFEPPCLEQADHPEWRQLSRHAWKIHSCLQELAENGADSAHFRFVHDMREVPAMDTRFDGPLIRSTTHTLFPRRNASPLPGRIEVESIGLGCDVMRYSIGGRIRLLEVVTTTPTDEDNVAVEMEYLVPHDLARKELDDLQSLSGWLVWQFEKDIPIWEHKRFHPHPPLCDGDGPIADFRRWCRQFD